jgi:hypothetical protein
MAHFAEIDSNNKVIRILVACNQDIANNGGELSEQAAKHFEIIAPLSPNGIKWIQTSYNHNFRKQYAGEGDTYDQVKDIFIKVPEGFFCFSNSISLYNCERIKVKNDDAIIKILSNYDKNHSWEKKEKFNTCEFRWRRIKIYSSWCKF